MAGPYWDIPPDEEFDRGDKFLSGVRNVYRSQAMKDKTMKNIQVVDGADNCTYSFFATTDEEFGAIFPDGTDVVYVENFFERVGKARGAEIIGGIWARPVKKSGAQGIHGTLFYL